MPSPSMRRCDGSWRGSGTPRMRKTILLSVGVGRRDALGDQQRRAARRRGQASVSDGDDVHREGGHGGESSDPPVALKIAGRPQVGIEGEGDEDDDGRQPVIG